MFERLRHWLGSAFDRHSQVSAEPNNSAVPAADVPPDAIHMARRLLAACLKSLGAADRISEISDVRISPYRHLIELLPLRVYVYNIGYPMGQMEYNSILNSRRPAGTVFDAFELSLSDVYCGFYVYSLQAVTDVATLRLLWRNLREEVGQPIKTAALPALHLAHHGSDGSGGGTPATSANADLEGEVIPLDNDAEAIVRMLVGRPPPSQQLATYTLNSPEDIMRPIFAFAMWGNEYPFEREELIDFAHRNIDVLRDSVDFLNGSVNDFVSAIKSYDEDNQQVAKVIDLVSIFVRQLNLILSGRETEVDVRSQNIYWLICILASQVSKHILSFNVAVRYLKRDDYRIRLGPATLRPMLLEYSRLLGTQDRQEPAKLHLLLEAAILCRDSAVTIAARDLLAESDGDPAVTSRLRGASDGTRESDLDDAGREFVREIRARTYTEIDDADL